MSLPLVVASSNKNGLVGKVHIHQTWFRVDGGRRRLSCLLKLLEPNPTDSLVYLFHRSSLHDLLSLLPNNPNLEIGLGNVLEEHVVSLSLRVVNVDIQAKVALNVIINTTE